MTVSDALATVKRYADGVFLPNEGFDGEDLREAHAALQSRIAELERDAAMFSLYQQAVNDIDDYIEHKGGKPMAFRGIEFGGGEIDKKRIHAILDKLTQDLAALHGQGGGE